MQSNGQKFGGESRELKPDPRIANLLGSLPQGQDVLPWQKVLAIVDNAPLVDVPWYSRVWHSNQRQLQFATVPAALFLVVCSLWAMPAQSDHAGTVVVTNLPAAWTVDSPAFREVEQAARNGFAPLDNQQTSLFIKVGTEGQTKKLVFALLGVGHDDAVKFYSKLRETYPALAAFNEDYIDVSNGHYKNRLAEIFDNLARKLNSRKLGKADEIKLNVLKFLRESGFNDIEVTVSKGGGGSLIIEIDATMKVSVPANVADELDTLGLTEELLGKAGFDSLVSELAAVN